MALFDGRRPGLIPGTDPGAPPDLLSSPDDEQPAGLPVAVPTSGRQSAPDPYDNDPLLQFARTLPADDSDPLLRAFDAPPPDEPSGPVHHLIPDPEPPGLLDRIGRGFTGSDDDARAMLDSAGDAVTSPLYSAAQGLGGAFNKLAGSVNTVAGAVPVLADHVVSAISGHESTDLQDKWFKTFVAPAIAQQSDFELGPGATFKDKAAHALGGMLGAISQIVLSGGAGEAAAPELGVKPTADFARAAIEHGVKSMTVPALTEAVDVGRKVYQDTGDSSKAVAAAQVSYLTTAASGILPMSAPGGLLTRSATGAASGAVVGELSRTAQNAFMPEDQQTPFDAEEAVIGAGTGALLGAVAGPRAPALAHVGEAISAAATDANRAQDAAFTAAMARPAGELESHPRYQELYNAATASTPEEKADYARQTLANELGQQAALKATAAALQPALDTSPTNLVPTARVSDMPPEHHTVPTEPQEGPHGHEFPDTSLTPSDARPPSPVGFGAAAQEARSKGVEPKTIAAITQAVLRKQVGPEDGQRLLQEAIAAIPKPTQETPSGELPNQPGPTVPVGGGEQPHPAIDATGHAPAVEPPAAAQPAPQEPAAAEPVAPAREPPANAAPVSEPAAAVTPPKVAAPAPTEAPPTHAIETVEPGDKGTGRQRSDLEIKRFLQAKRPPENDLQRIISYRTESVVGANEAREKNAPQHVQDFLRGEHEWAMERLRELSPETAAQFDEPQARDDHAPHEQIDQVGELRKNKLVRINQEGNQDNGNVAAVDHIFRHRPGDEPIVAVHHEAGGRETFAPHELKPMGDDEAVVYGFRKRLTEGEPMKSIIEARQIYKRVTGETPEGPRVKHVDELLERAVVSHAREIVQKTPERTGAYDKLVNLYKRQPKLGTRTSTSVADQAYSTPAPLALVASHLAGIDAESKVYEPTAGNGMLLIGANPKNVTANELNADRAGSLRAQGFKTTQGDALDPTNRPRPRSQDVVIANPPFGAVRDAEGQSKLFSIVWPDGSKLNTTNVDFAIAARALDAMKDNGRGVLIIGGLAKTAQSIEARSDGYNGSARRKFFYNLYRNYHVADHFTVAGELYEKQGAGWPVDVIQITGRKPSTRALPAVDVPRVYDSWDALKPLLDTHVNRDAATDASRLGTLDRGTPSDDIGRDVPPGTEARAEPVLEPAGRSNPDVGEPVPGPAGGDERAGGGPAPGGPAAGRGEREAGAGGAVADRAQPGDSGTPGQPGPAAEPVAEAPGAAGSAVGDQGGQERPAEPPAKLGRSSQQTALTDTAQVAYKPSSTAPAIGTLVPGGMQTAVHDSLGTLVDRVGPLNEYVAKQLGYKPDEIGKYFSGEQVDALSLALNQIDRGAGFIIGDQTGVGKGRVVAGVIRFALKKGLTPIFVTEKPNLYADMYRDLTDIGQKDIRPLMTNGGETVPLNDSGSLTLKTPGSTKHNADLTRMAGEASLGEHNMVFTTYSQMQTLKGELTARQRFLQAMVPNSVVIMDESHNAGGNDAGSRAKKGQDGKTGRAGFARALVGQAKSVFYSSATYAKRPSVMDLYFKTDMAKAVEGNVKKLPDAIAAGGVPLQQVVAAMLTKAGQYIRRERSFDGVEYSTPLVPVDRKAAEGISHIMLGVKEFDDFKGPAVEHMKQQLKAEAKALSSDGSTGGAGVESTNFTSIMHNLIDQMLLALKADTAADRAIEALKNGEKPVITVSNTMGSFLQSYAESASLKGGDAVGLTFRDLLKRYLERSRYVTVKSPDGKVTSHYITNEELGRLGVDKFKEVMQSIDAAKAIQAVPVSPIDWIHSRLRQAGYSSSEITGRTHTVEYGAKDTNPIYRIRGSKETSIAGRRKVITDFNSGKLDALVLNQAGSTGLSLHASEKFKDQRRRRMVIAQAEKNIDTHMQMLGRVHRTGQVIAPAYDQLVADVPAEKRPAAVLAKKMASLNANTTASRSSQFTAKDSVDFLNPYGDEVAAQLMEDMPEVHHMLGDPLDSEDRGYRREDAARKVTGRIPLLPVSEQESLYDLLESGYKDAIARADALGENALEAKTLALDARSISRQEVFAGKPGDDSPFAASAYADTVDVKRLGKPYTSDQVLEMVAEKTGGDKKDSIEQLARAGLRKQSQTMTEVAAEFAKYRTAEEAKMLASEASDQAREGRLAMLDGAMSRWRSLMQGVHIGGQYELTLPDGSSLYGVVTDIRRKATVKMPVAGGAWLVHFALADGSRAVTVPTSKLSFGTHVEGTIGIERRTRNSLTGSPVMKMFDEGQSSTREKRVVFNGNLLAGYSKAGRGQIISYTTHDGRLEQGILMPRGFDLKAFAEGQPVELKSEQLRSFFDRAQTAIVQTADGTFQIRQVGDEYLLSTPKSKSEGAKYFLDQGLRAIVGDFTSRGDSMQVRVDSATMERAARYVQTNIGEKLRTESYKDEARAVGGVSFSAAPKGWESVGGGNSVPEVRSWLDKATQEVKSLVNVHVVENTNELAQRLGRDSVPDSVRGAFVRRGNEVYIVANQVADRDDAERVFTHEVFGHLAVERYADMRKVVDSVLKLHELGSPTVTRLWKEISKAESYGTPQEKAREVVARMAEGGIKNALMDRMITAARNLLRKMGAKLKYSEPELRQLIASAARALREDAQRLSPADDVLAHQADTAYKSGDDRALGDALGKMSIARSQLDVLPDLKTAGPEQHALDAAVAEQLVGTAPRSNLGEAPLYSMRVKEDPEIKAIRKRIMANAANEDLPFKDRMRNLVQRWTNLSGLAMRQGFVDAFASIGALEKLLNEGKLLDASASPYKQAVATQNLPSVMTAIIKHGVPVFRDGAYEVAGDGRQGLLDIFAPLVNHKDGNLLPQWELYAAARRASRLIEEKNPDGTSREKLFTKPDIERSMKLAEQYPEFGTAFDSWQKFNQQVLDMAQEAGLINPESRALWESNDYVPFYRAVQDVSGMVNPVSLRRAIANQRSKIMTLHGGTQPLEDVFESMLMNTAHLVDASFKNRAAQTMVKMFDGVATTPVNMDAKPVNIDISQVRRALDSAGITLADKLTPEQNKQWVTFFQRVKPAADNVVGVMFDGKPKYYEVHDPLLLQSITEMSPNQSLKWLDVLGFTGAKRLLTRTATALPSFMVRNFIRDTQSTWVQNPVGLKPFISAAKGLADYARGDPVVRDLMLAGAGGDAVYDNQPGNIKKILIREMKAEAADSFLKTVASPARLWEMYTHLQQASEQANRIAVYKGARAQGMSHAEAAYRAHDVLNFQQHGAYPGVQFLTRVVPFLNARIQGLDRLYRAFHEDRNGTLLKGALMAAFTGLTMYLGQNDKRYEELQEWDRDAYWHLFLGDQHWRIPKGFEVGALFGTMPERAIRLMLGKDTWKATGQSLLNMIVNTFAFNPIPQLARPIVEDITNYDFFTGRPIINAQQQEQIAPLQAQPNTSPTLQRIAGLEPDWMPDSLRSPLRLEHWIRGYTSAIGMLGLTAADRLTRATGGYPDAPSKPWYELYVPATPVTTSAPHNTKFTDQLYTMAAEADAAAKAVKSYASQGRMEELRAEAKRDGQKLALRPALDSMVREFGDLNRRQRAILESRMDPDRKQLMIDKINVQRANLARQLAPYAGAF